jgi:hypothetical protein
VPEVELRLNSDGYGVYGASQTASGVYGETTSQTNYGVSGVNNSQWPCTAILGTSSNGHGVRGTNGAGSGSQPTAGCGVWGDSNQGYGAYGSSKSGTGILGTSSTSHGVRGVTGAGGGAQPTASCGVWGDSDQGIGIYGSSKNGTAGYFVGTVTVTGVVNVSTNINVAGDVNVTGNIKVAGDVVLVGADCAEQFDLKALEIAEPGTVMVIDDNGALRESDKAYDRTVAGVVSGAGAFKPAILLDQRGGNEARTNIALVGKVYCKVDADASPIAVGDLLTTSHTPGHAMKAADPLKAFGAVIGKALAPVRGGRELIPILVTLQ